jgi:ketosteroid isomerase-like protein
MSTSSENKELLQRIFDGLATGNSRPFVEAMDEGFSWTITGHTRWSRTWRGKQAVLGELFPALRARLDGRIRTVAHRIVADEAHVVVEARGDNVTRSGERYDNAYCYVFRVSGGKLQDVTEYLDTALVAAVMGDPPDAAR